MAWRIKPHQGPSLFTESPIPVIVGDNRTRYYVHPGVLATYHSSAISARVNGPWRVHGADEPIDWTDFDEQTVGCILSYLYTGDYHVPGFIPDDDDDISESAEDTPHPDAIDPEEPLTPLSECIPPGLPADCIKTSAGYFDETPAHNNSKLGRAVLLHTKVYIFANRYVLSELEDFALQRLTQVLLECDPSSASLFPHLVEAIHLVYDSTPGRAVQDNPARKLFSQYVALNYTEFGVENMDTLMAEGGDFVVELSQKLARMLTRTSGYSQSLQEEVAELELRVESLVTECKTKKDDLSRVRKERNRLSRAQKETGPWGNSKREALPRPRRGKAE